jgi:hypothetical protein
MSAELFAQAIEISERVPSRPKSVTNLLYIAVIGEGTDFF